MCHFSRQATVISYRSDSTSGRTARLPSFAGERRSQPWTSIRSSRSDATMLYLRCSSGQMRQGFPIGKRTQKKHFTMWYCPDANTFPVPGLQNGTPACETSCISRVGSNEGSTSSVALLFSGPPSASASPPRPPRPPGLSQPQRLLDC